MDDEITIFMVSTSSVAQIEEKIYFSELVDGTVDMEQETRNISGTRWRTRTRTPPCLYKGGYGTRNVPIHATSQVSQFIWQSFRRVHNLKFSIRSFLRRPFANLLIDILSSYYEFWRNCPVDFKLVYLLHKDIGNRSAKLLNSINYVARKTQEA